MTFQNFYKPVVIGNATLYHGDAYEIAPVLGPMDALVSDPQYEFSTSGGGKFRKARRNLEDIQEAGLNKGFDLKIIDPALYPSVVLFCHENQVFKIGIHLQERYRRVALLAWQKTNPIPFANKNYMAEGEIYIHAWNKGAHPVGEIQDRKRLFTHKNGQSEFDHPTVKPLPVMRKIINNVNGQTIFDPFAGTGSTGIAALEAGKKFVGIESNPKFFNIMCSRFFDYYTDLK